MLLEDELESELLYAAGDFDRWPPLLERIATRCGAIGAGLLPAHDPSQFRVTRSVVPGFTQYLADEIHLSDPRLALAPKLAHSKVVGDTDAYSPSEMARMSYYSEWLPQQRLGDFLGVRGGSPDDPFVLTLYRETGDRPWSAAEREALASLSDAMMRTVALDKAIGSRALADRVNWFEQTDAGVIGLCADGRVAFVGGTADRFLSAAMRVEHDRLVFADADEERRFLRSLAQSEHLTHMTALGRSVDRVFPDRVYLRARTDWRSFTGGGAASGHATAVAIDIHPVVEGYRGFVSAAHLLVLSDPFARRRANECAFTALWDLSAREAELVAHLCDGHLLREAAAGMGIREESARTYLKSIFRKTGTRAQSELVAAAAHL